MSPGSVNEEGDETPGSKLSPNDFDLICLAGSGAFGKVRKKFLIGNNQN